MISDKGRREQLLDILHSAANHKTRVDLEGENEELRQQVEGLQSKILFLAPHTCACAWDKPDDLCMHHSPKLSELRNDYEDALKKAADDVNRNRQENTRLREAAHQALGSLKDIGAENGPSAWILRDALQAGKEP